MCMISVVIPVLNEEKGIKVNVDTIIKNIPCDYELIIVDDGSKDSTWSIIKEMSEKNKNIIGVRFSRNFGKEAALMAGLNVSKGDAVITMDSDLQHPPRYIPNMIKKWQEGYKVVEYKRKKRNKESFIYRTCANIFFGSCKFKEGQLFFRGIVDWVGFDKYVEEIDFDMREIGKSKFKFKSLSRLALNAVTSFSSCILYLTAIIGAIFFIVALILAIQTIVRKIMGLALEGFTTMILLQLIIGSLVMFCLAILGIYVGKIYEESKGRPQYIISELCRKD